MSVDILERAAGIEPASSAWKAEVLPLNYARCARQLLVVGAGFEPAKLARQIYSLIPLAAREPHLKRARHSAYRTVDCQSPATVSYAEIGVL